MAISEYNKTLLNKMNSTAHKVSLGDLMGDALDGVTAAEAAADAAAASAVEASDSADDAAASIAELVAYTSDASAGGAATEAMVLTGLAAGDTILSVHQKTQGANSLALIGWSTQAANALTGIWAADPGAGAVIVVLVKKA